MSKRNFGIDLLRIISMIMVVTLHVLEQGGILDSATRFSFNYEIAWFLRTASFCAVNCYALISGFVGVDSEFKYSNIFYLWLQVVFCRILVTDIFYISMPNTVSVLDLIKAFFPILFPQHWYFTAYFGMFFFIPCFNHLIHSAPQKQLRHLLFIIVLLFSVLPTIRRSDYFCTAEGYSMLWLSLLYIIGGYIKKYYISKNISVTKSLLVYLSCILITWLSKLTIELTAEKLLGTYQKGVILITYTSPTILFASIALLLCFSALKPALTFQKIISFFAPLAFSVYLIHTHPLVWNHMMANRFIPLAQFTPMKFIISVIAIVAGIYLVCSMIDYIRLLIFNKLKLRLRCQTIELCIKNCVSKREKD